MKITVTKQFTFDAAHFLTDYEGDCSRMHGHTYKLEVTVGGSMVGDMVIDFKLLNEVVKERIISKLDHQLLNEVLPFRTTAENIAEWAFKKLFFIEGCPIERIRLWETPTSFAEVTR
jgi:6-pyruvoyltetrahydropterin/6-carboxytetrahydropterin synthase